MTELNENKLKLAVTVHWSEGSMVQML